MPDEFDQSYSAYADKRAAMEAMGRRSMDERMAADPYANRFGVLEDPNLIENQWRHLAFMHADQERAFAEDMRRRAMDDRVSTAFMRAGQGLGQTQRAAAMQGNANDPLAQRRAAYVAAQQGMAAIGQAGQMRAQEQMTTEAAVLEAQARYADLERAIQQRATQWQIGGDAAAAQNQIQAWQKQAADEQHMTGIYGAALQAGGAGAGIVGQGGRSQGGYAPQTTSDIRAKRKVRY